MSREFRNRTEQVPYDRELIRSGGASRGDQRRQAVPSRARRRSSTPRSRRGIGATLRIVLLLVLIPIIVVVGLLFTRAATFNDSVSSAGFPSTALLWSLNGSDRVNVLLVGYGGAEHQGAYLADSIQILSIDPETDTTTTVPIPRDLWIEGVESYPGNGKVNEVFSTGHAEGGVDGGAALLAEVLSEITGLEIEHWLAIDFAGFREMIDAVGGVTVENPTAFSYTWLEDEHQAGIWTTGSFPAGELTLNGEDALTYSRVRYASVPSEANDFARSVRQARVLGALRSKLGDGGLASIGPGLELMDAMEGRVRTDLSAIDLAMLSSHLQSDRRIELTQDVVLRATSNTIGQYILIPMNWTGPGDYGSVQEYLRGELDGAP